MKSLKQRLRLLSVALALTITLPIVGCDSAEPTSSRITEFGVDDIHFGETFGDVVAKLGRPSGNAFIDGLNSFEGIVYGDTIEVFTTDGVIADSSVVRAFFMRTSYSGTTHSGIGVQSSRAEVESTLGNPHYIYQSVFHVYCLGSRFLQIGIDGDNVDSIFYGETLPGANPPPC